jgi:hypothetical protein
MKKMNKDMDLPPMTENREEKIIEKIAWQIVLHVEPLFNVICGSVYTNAIKIMLSKPIPIEEN